MGRAADAQIQIGKRNERVSVKALMQNVRRAGCRSSVAWVLLVLISYASLTIATHHHSQVPPPASDPSISSSEDKEPNGAPFSGDSSNCATCRLQRTFDSALRAPSISFNLTAPFVVHETLPCNRHLSGACVVFSSRGPPLCHQPSLNQSGVVA
jgi:hypothetical protein